MGPGRRQSKERRQTSRARTVIFIPQPLRCHCEERRPAATRQSPGVSEDTRDLGNPQSRRGSPAAFPDQAARRRFYLASAGSGDCFAHTRNDSEKEPIKNKAEPTTTSSPLSLRGAAPRRDAAIPKVSEDARDRGNPQSRRGSPAAFPDQAAPRRFYLASAGSGDCFAYARNDMRRGAITFRRRRLHNTPKSQPRGGDARPGDAPLFSIRTRRRPGRRRGDSRRAFQRSGPTSTGCSPRRRQTPRTTGARTAGWSPARPR